MVLTAAASLRLLKGLKKFITPNFSGCLKISWPADVRVFPHPPPQRRKGLVTWLVLFCSITEIHNQKSPSFSLLCLWPFSLRAVEWNLSELTTKSDCGQLLLVVLLYLRMRGSILCGAFSGYTLPPPPLDFPLFISVTSAFSCRRCSLHLGAGC